MTHPFISASLHPLVCVRCGREENNYRYHPKPLPHLPLADGMDCKYCGPDLCPALSYHVSEIEKAPEPLTSDELWGKPAPRCVKCQQPATVFRSTPDGDMCLNCQPFEKAPRCVSGQCHAKRHNDCWCPSMCDCACHRVINGCVTVAGIYSRPECTFLFCPHPEHCEDMCCNTRVLP